MEVKNMEKIVCPTCSSTYNIIDDIPVLLIHEKLTDFKRKESEFHSKIAKEADDAHHLNSLRVKYLHDDFLDPIRKRL